MMVKQSWILKQDAGDGKMKEISEHIYEGALAFLNAEYRLLTIFVVAVSVLLFVVSTSAFYTLDDCDCFCGWCFFLGFGWKYGNEDSNETNVRTTQAARTSS